MSDPSAGLAGAAAPDGPSDAELITAVRGGSADSYGLLWQRHVDAARRLARQLASSGAEADDLVAEAFAKVLETLRGGGGPDAAFRAYLLTTLRNTFYDRIKRDKRLQLTDDMSAVDPGVPFTDTALDALESSLAARAFASLPERWQTVLWHTEIEGESPAAVAPILGLTANGVAALAYRAREGLRQAYLQMHLSDTAADPCRSTVERLGAWARKGLSKRENAQVDAHLDNCDRCRALALELLDVNHGLRGIVAPLILGAPVVAGYLAAGATKAAAVGAAAGHGGLAWLHWGSSPAKAAGVAAGAAAVAAGGIFAAVAFTGGGSHTAEPPVGGITVTSASSAAPSTLAPPPPGRTSAAAPSAPSTGAQSPPSVGPSDITSASSSTAPVVIVPPPDNPAPPPRDEPEGQPTQAPPTTAPTTTAPTTTAPTSTAPTTTAPPTTAPTSTAPTTTAPTVTPTSAPPTTSPPPVLEADITPSFEAIGNLVRGGNAMLKIVVGNAGPDATGALTATLDLPPGVSFVGVQGSGWSAGGAAPDAQPAAFAVNRLDRGPTVALAADEEPPATQCSADDPDENDPAAWTTVTLTGPSVEKNGSSTLYVRVGVAAEAACGTAPSLSVTGANQGSTPPATLTTSATVTDVGMRAAAAYQGHAKLISVGNTFLSCPPTDPRCEPARHFDAAPRYLDNNGWDEMAPLTMDPSNTGTPTTAVDLGDLDGAHVVWAGLYWSTSTSDEAAPIRLCRGLSGCVTDTTPSIGPDHVDPAGGGYQAFADVTDLVTSGGTWWASLSSTTAGTNAYAGWSLMVIVAGDDLPAQQIVVLDGPQSVGDSAASIEFQAAGATAVVHTVAWEGDHTYTGDQITVDGTLPSAGGQCPMAAAPGDDDLADHDGPPNMECGTATGAVPDVAGQPWNTFGVDVHRHTYALYDDAGHTLEARTTSDPFILGVVGIETGI